MTPPPACHRRRRPRLRRGVARRLRQLRHHIIDRRSCVLQRCRGHHARFDGGRFQTGQLFSLLDLETGKVVGFDAGLSQVLAQYILGEPTSELTVTTVDTRETLIQNGSVDLVVATYSITPARAEKIAFAGPYLVSGAAIMVLADNSDITGVADLAGKTVTTQPNSTTLTALQDQVPTAKLQPYTNEAECVAARTQGRADAWAIDQSILISDAIGKPAVKVAGEPFTVDPYGIGVTKDDPSVKALVNAWLKTIEDDGSWADLWKATIGTVVEGDAPAPSPSVRFPVPDAVALLGPRGAAPQWVSCCPICPRCWPGGATMGAPPDAGRRSAEVMR